MIGLITNFLGTPNNGGVITESGGKPGDPDNPQTGSEGHRNAILEDEDVLPVIVEKFRRGEVTEEQVKILRKHLNFDKSDGVEVKLDHLSNKINDLEAYTDALETFIDNEGTADEIINELRSDIQTTQEDLRNLSDRVDAIDMEQASIQEALTQQEESIDSLDDFVRELDGRHSREIMGVDAKIDRAEVAFDESLQSIQNDLEAIRSRVESVEMMEEPLESLESEVEGLHQLESTLSAVQDELAEVKTVRSEVSELRATVEELEGIPDEVESLRELEERVAEIDRLSDEIEEMQDSMADMESFRTKLIDTVSMDGVSSTGD